MARHGTVSLPSAKEQSVYISYIPMTSLHTVFLVLFLTVVIPQPCLCLHREGRPLSSGGSIPCSGGVPSYSLSLLLMFLVAIGDRLNQIYSDAYRNSAKSATGSLRLWHN